MVPQIESMILKDLEIKDWPSLHPISDHYRPASETPFGVRFDGGPMVARFDVLTGEFLVLTRLLILVSRDLLKSKVLVLKVPSITARGARTIKSLLLLQKSSERII